MEDFKVLKLLDKFKGLFERFSIEYALMRKILQVKLTMDRRRVPTIMNNYNQKNGEKTNAFNMSLLMYTFIGLLTMSFVLLPLPMFFAMSIVWGMVIFMVMSVMISDFSAVLLDTQDKNILLSRPVEPKTLSAAKIIHILIYMSTIISAIAGPSLIGGSIKYGIVFFITFLIELILVSGFIIFFTAILYFLILLFFDGEKLKDIINYFQILLSIVMLIGYQLVGRVFDLVNVKGISNPKWWSYILPSVWFAAPFHMLIAHNYQSYTIILSLIGIIIPITVFIIYFKYIIPYFEKNLQKLENNSSSKNKSMERRDERHRKAANLFCNNKTEKVFYRFTHNMLAIERKFKLRLYPNLALSIVMPFIFMITFIRGSKSFHDAILAISKGKSYLWIYFTIAMVSSVITMISTSEKYKGAWIYKAFPLESPIPIFKGAVKAVFARIMLPVFLFESIIFLPIYGVKILQDLVLMFLNMILLMLIYFKACKKELPFCKKIETNQSSDNAGIIIGVMFIVPVLAGIHFGASFIKFGIIADSIATLIIVTLLWNTSFKFSWKDIFKEKY